MGDTAREAMVRIGSERSCGPSRFVGGVESGREGRFKHGIWVSSFLPLSLSRSLGVAEGNIPHIFFCARGDRRARALVE